MSVRPVGDGLLLQFLEDECIVQCGGQQVGQRIHDQPVRRFEGVFLLALHVQNAEKVVAVGNRDAKHGARSRQHALQGRLARGLHQGSFASPGHPAENAHSQRDPLPQRLGGDAGLGLDFNFLGRVVENADADVIEAEILLDVSDNVGQHLFRILAGNGSLGNIVQEAQLAGAPLLLGKKPGILYRNRNLSGRGLHHFQIALLEGVLALSVERGHDSRRAASQQDGRTAKTFGRSRRDKGDAQPLPRFLQLRADQQRLPAANDELAQAIGQPARAPGQDLALFRFQLETDFIAFLECDVEISGVKDLAQFFLHRAHDFILIQARADRLPNLGEQGKFLGAALRVVHDHIIFQGQADLQGQSNQQTQVRRTEHPPRGVRKQDDSEIVLAGLQAHRGDVVNVLFRHHLAELQEPAARKGGQGLGHFRHAAEGHESAAPVGQFADVLSGPTFFQLLQELGRKPSLHRGQHGAPALADANHGPARRQGRDQAVQNALHARTQVLGRKQPRGIHAQGREGQGIFLDGAALIFRQHHHHRDAQRQLRDRAQQVGELQVGIAELPEQHQHRPQRQRHGQQCEGQRIPPVRVAVEEEGAVEQHQGDAYFHSKARVRNYFRMKYSSHHALLQVPKT